MRVYIQGNPPGFISKSILGYTWEGGLRQSFFLYYLFHGSKLYFLHLSQTAALLKNGAKFNTKRSRESNFGKYLVSQISKISKNGTDGSVLLLITGTMAPKFN